MVIKGNNLIFIKYPFCARHCAKNFLNINSALNLSKTFRSRNTVFPFYL